MSIDTGFSIEGKELQCSKCNSKHTLERSKSVYDLCNCKNIRLVYCREEIHITLFEEKKDFWYEYESTIIIKTK